jgi:hypoxanthine phosphoribosyltransferase
MSKNDSENIPSNFQPLYTRAHINEAVVRLGKDITRWAHETWEESHTDILAIPILRGGLFFFADLVREVQHSVEIAPARTWAYEDTVNNVQRHSVKINIEGVPAKGRNILLVDDICDSGRTLKALKENLLEQGARTVKSAVLVSRVMDNAVFQSDWSGFSYQGPEWLVGYGMDDCDRWRNLGSIYIIKQG